MLLFSCYIVSDSFVTPLMVAPLGSSVHGISQARILEWLAISFSRNSWRESNKHLLHRGFVFFITEPPGKPRNKKQQQEKTIEDNTDSMKTILKHKYTCTIGKWQSWDFLHIRAGFCGHIWKNNHGNLIKSPKNLKNI